MTTKELTENPQEACAAWPETTWNGFNVHKDIYELISNDIEPLLTEKGYTFQECYLAYLDHTNSGDEPNGFVVGWDIWTDDGFTSAYCQFNVQIEYGGPNMSRRFINLDHSQRIEFDGLNECDGFYNRKNGAYKKLHSEWGGLIELRLD